MLQEIKDSPKRIFVLGAGSSISHDRSFPSIKDFFAKAREAGIDLSGEFPELCQYALDNFGINIGDGSKTASVNIETIFTNLEIDLERSQNALLQQIKDQLLVMIQRILLQVAEKGKNSESKDGDLNRLVQLLGPSDTVITFNWDILLDGFLGREEVLQWIKHQGEPVKNCYWNFVAQMSGHGENILDNMEYRPPYTTWDNKSGYFLKMHGSIDWIFCKNELCKIVGKGFLSQSIGQTRYCSNCHEPVEALLIPPVLNKQYRQYHLIRRIWNTALKEVETANDLIIWGYSLPETDFYSSWLLRNARKTLNTLTIINPDVIVGDKRKINENYLARFRDIFKGFLQDDSIMLYENFNDYLNKVDIYGKYEINRVAI